MFAVLNSLAEKIRGRLEFAFEKNKMNVQVTGSGSLFNAYFTKEDVEDANAIFKADRKN